MTKPKAFTLVEMVMVIVIIGLLTAIIIPKFAAHRENAVYTVTYHNMNILRDTIYMYYGKEGEYPDVYNGLSELIEKGYLRNIPMQTITSPHSNVVYYDNRPVKTGWIYTTHRNSVGGKLQVFIMPNLPIDQRMDSPSTPMTARPSSPRWTILAIYSSRGTI